MSDISQNSESQYLLDKKVVNAPLSWKDVTITAEYKGDDIQPTLTTDSFVFKLEAREAINGWISKGMTGGVGIFEGMPFDLRVFNQDSSKVFESFLDFTSNYKDFPDDGDVSVDLIDKNGLDGFLAQLTGTTFGYLESIGVFTDGDYTEVEYVVEKKFNLLELIIASVTLYIMTKEFVEQVIETVTAIQRTIAAAIPSVGAGAVVNVGNILFAVLSIILRLVYLALMLVAIIELSKALFESLVSPKRNS